MSAAHHVGAGPVLLDLNGRVAIVTGAARGMGREIALALARRGTSIVVNDYGGGASSVKAGDIAVAQSVVDEITALGGNAIADGSSVGTGESAQTIVDAAMSAFGRVDILVTNAGGNITTEVDALSDERVEAILRSNFTGGYMLLRKAWPIMREAGFGRIVNIMSGSLLGLHGRAAYASGKAAYFGLTSVAATEGEPFDIRVNGIWPTAKTRLMAGIDDPEMIAMMERYPPHLVAEAVTYFCSPECRATGEFFDVGGGRVARIAIHDCEGFSDPALTAESLAANIELARDMNQSRAMGQS